MIDEKDVRRRRRRGEIPVRVINAEPSGDPAEDMGQQKKDHEERLTGSAKLLLLLQLHHRHGYGVYETKKDKGK